jgi:hypothetical protein
LTIELDKVTYVNEPEKETLIQELDTLAKQRDETILNLNRELRKTTKPDTMKTNSSLDSFLGFQPLQKARQGDYMSRLETSDGNQKDFYEPSRDLKANECMQILKALTSPKNKVIDLESLRKYLQDVSNILKQVGLLGAADICIRDEDPITIIQRHETMWKNNPKKDEIIKS